MEKKYRNAKDGSREVAVLVSGGFGAGWYTWGLPEDALFDPIMVDFVETRKLSNVECLEYMESKWPNGYFGGASDLYVCWVPEGCEFRIEEYDGNETLIVNQENYWKTA